MPTGKRRYTFYALPDVDAFLRKLDKDSDDSYSRTINELIRIAIQNHPESMSLRQRVAAIEIHMAGLQQQIIRMDREEQS